MSSWQSSIRLLFACVLLAAVTMAHPAFAWDDAGHKIIALIAKHYLDPAVRARLATLLVTDTDALTDHDIASEATWADSIGTATARRPRSATKRPGSGTLSISNSRILICTRPVLATYRSLPASQGPPRACVVDKIDQFAAELGNPAIDAPEQLLALKFLLHLVGDLHQPLHAGDDHDAAATRSSSRRKGFVPATFIITGISRSSSG
jgi:hypothetical protein